MDLKNRRSLVITLVSIVLLVFSLTQESYCFADTCGDAMAAFLLGAIGFVQGGAVGCWLANPFLLLSWILSMKNPKVSLVFSGIALIIGVSFLRFNSIIADEAGNYEKIVGYAAGYWLWLASMAVMVVGNSYLYYVKKTIDR